MVSQVISSVSSLQASVWIVRWNKHEFLLPDPCIHTTDNYSFSLEALSVKSFVKLDPN
jgi:hypothetical protein